MADAAWVSQWAAAGRRGSCAMLRLPLEVLLRIAARLTTPELGALRLTCRAVEELLYVTFTNEFFTRKQFMITDNSLQALVDISRSRLGEHLRFLQIGLDRFPEGIQRPLPDEDKERAFKQRYSDHFTLWNTGCHCQMLSEALRNLPKLEAVVLRDYNSTKRRRDGPGAEWTSYGSTTIFRETGIRLSQGSQGAWNSAIPFQGCSQVFALVLHALGVAGARPKGIEVLAHNGNHLRDFGFNIPRFVEPSVLPVLRGLEKLHLSVDLSWRTALAGWGQGPTAYAAQTAAPDTLLRRFLSETTNLRDLRINERHDPNPALGDFLEWLGGRPPAGGSGTGSGPAGSPPPVAMPHLEKLSLGLMNAWAPTLLRVVGKFAPTLRSLSLWRVTLQRPLPPGSDTNDPPRCIFWADFLNQLRQTPQLNLRHLMLGMIGQAYTHRPRSYMVTFKRRDTKVEYTGLQWKYFVDEVLQQLDVKWPHTVTPEDESPDDDDDGDDEADDGEGVDDDGDVVVVGEDEESDEEDDEEEQ